MTNSNFHILQNKNAFNVFLSQLISTICDKMMSIGLVWYLTKEYSINVVPWFLMVSFLPHIFMSFYASGIINRLGVLKTVIRSEYIRGLILLVLFGVLFLVPAKSTGFLVALFISAFLVGVCSSLFNPAILSLPPSLVESEKVPALNAILDTSFSVSNILGAACSIFLLNIFDIKTLVLINALSFFVAAILQSRVSLLSTSQNAEGSEGTANGPMQVLKKYPMIMRMLLSFLFINVVFTPILVMIPWYVENIFKGDASDLALIEGAMGLGAFLTGMYLSVKSFAIREDRRIAMIAFICFLFGIFFQVFSFSTSTGEASFLLFLIGIISTFLNVQVLTYFQISLKEEEVPAIMVAVNIISAASMPLSFAISGILFPRVDIPHFALMCGILTMLIAFCMPSFLKHQPQEGKV
ncbi:MAG: MFS transporter [Bdellovibrionales bacterium]|nr:MFS transporter [Bdellovibrionales bacterium]